MALVYPATLPVPQTSTVTPKERRAFSDPDYPREAVALERDRSRTESITWPPMDAAQLAIFWAWWRDELIYGGAWFAATWPIPDGMVAATRKFLEVPQREYHAPGYWQLSVLCEIRGLGVIPADQELTPWQIEGLPDNGTVLLYDSFNTPGVIDGTPTTIPGSLWDFVPGFEQTVSGGALEVTSSTFSSVSTPIEVPAVSEISMWFGTEGISGVTAPQYEVDFNGGSDVVIFGVPGGGDGDTAYVYVNGTNYLETPISDGLFAVSVKLYDTISDNVELFVNGLSLGTETIAFNGNLFDGSSVVTWVGLYESTAENTVRITYAILGCNG